MFSRLREHFGTAGLVVAIVALIAALGGGAYAATGGSGGGKATASAKQGKRGKQGKPGKTGPAGPAGPTGPTGARGDAGAKGDAGAPGSNGTPGAEGKSVTGEAIAAGGACGVGVTGVKYTLNGNPSTVCNGKNGTNGTTGFTETLPSGETETGTWTASSPSETPNLPSQISFGIPLEVAPEMIYVSLTYEENPGEAYEVFEVEEIFEDAAEQGCPGFTDAGIPLADPGKLCVYGSFEQNVKPNLAHATLLPAVNFSEEKIYSGGGQTPNLTKFGSGVVDGAGPSGTALFLDCKNACIGKGAWAVTAE
ncbi:MAG TPA: hypothetical protein VH275_09965 [Solirubrobacterales bacterium]|jgi:hypothetical protein|nr:hypothetical protein [Solirubrobacterales bacterium]